MSVEGHISELSERHKVLDRQIAEEASRPGSDDMEIRRMKLEKLRLKEEITRLSREPRH